MKKILNKIRYYINNYNILILCQPFFFISSLFYCLFLNYNENKNYYDTQDRMILIPVMYPNEQPNHSMNDIDLAIALFSIDIPEYTIYPVYTPKLPYRGLTTGDAFFPMKRIFIGDMAFISWGILGSTLGHEIEVHCKQSFLKIELLNFLYLVINYPKEFISKTFPLLITPKYENIGFGSYLAEQEAYLYEINSKNRFHLNKTEIIVIKDILENKLI